MTDTPGGVWKVECRIGEGEPMIWWVLTTNIDRAMGGVRGALDRTDIEFISVQKMTRRGTIVIDPDLLEAGGYVLQGDDDEEDPFE